MADVIGAHPRKAAKKRKARSKKETKAVAVDTPVGQMIPINTDHIKDESISREFVIFIFVIEPSGF
jgi:hypothetical protein